MEQIDQKKTYKEYVNLQIANKNPWYINSQFAWAQKAEIKKIYKKRNQFFSNIINRVISQKKKIRLLDYGCGDGYWTLIFSQIKNCTVVGVDYNPLRLKRARLINPNVKFIQTDLRKKNPPLGKYDLVFCSQVVEHIEDDITFLKIIRTYLKKDGILILGCPNDGSLTQRIRACYSPIKSDHVHYYTEHEIKTKIRHAGFKINKIMREVFYPGWDKLFYMLTSTNYGFKLLELLTILFPSLCSDYYFECQMW
ncbi:MAG: class I SAM-dependent methyltransferase [Candidatus Helarchaeota archaeon]